MGSIVFAGIACSFFSIVGLALFILPTELKSRIRNKLNEL